MKRILLTLLSMVVYCLAKETETQDSRIGEYTETEEADDNGDDKSSTTPPWHASLASLPAYIKWCGNPDCRLHLLVENDEYYKTFSSPKTDGERWKVCGEYFDDLKLEVITHHPNLTVPDYAVLIIANLSLCDYYVDTNSSTETMESHASFSSSYSKIELIVIVVANMIIIVLVISIVTLYLQYKAAKKLAKSLPKPKKAATARELEIGWST